MHRTTLVPLLDMGQSFSLPLRLADFNTKLENAGDVNESFSVWKAEVYCCWNQPLSIAIIYILNYI